MSIQKALLIELEREKNNTLRILKNLRSEDFGWKPHEKSMTLGQLANHIVELHDWVAFALTKDVFDFHTDYVPSTLTTVDELIERLDKGFETKDRKSTRLNSSHVRISYAVFCLKKKKK